ncbi:MAG: hypothetical protein PWP23_3239 [Candidatus Sumerlaeota bacterium]|nr:hypothetical protein [Candidatus Sumerlaeota bacterium]
MELTFTNNPAHVKDVAIKMEKKRENNAQTLAFGFWAGVVVGGLTTVALVITWLATHSVGH